MHSISPYLVRIRYKNSRDNLKLHNINFLSLLNNFIQSKNSLGCDNGTNQAYFFENTNYDQSKRKVYGWFKAGSYGTSTDIHDIHTGNKEFDKTRNHADIAKYYFQFCLSSDPRDEGLCVFHKYSVNGIKTLFQAEFNKYLESRQPQLVMFLTPISYKKSFNKWKDAQVKDLRITKFSGFSDDTDRMRGLGHDEQFDSYELKIKLKQGLKLSGFFNSNSEEKRLIEICTPFGEQVKTVVDYHGKKRTINLGYNADLQFCNIELDEDDSTVTIEDGFPEFNSFHEWVNSILDEYLEDLYPPR
jgi:hypothetical protein